MQILPTSANISFRKKGAVLATKIEATRIHFHLTKGFHPNEDLRKHAIFFDGSVDAITTKAEFASWRFGFIQLMELVNYKVEYYGRTPGDGKVMCMMRTQISCTCSRSWIEMDGMAAFHSSRSVLTSTRRSEKT